MWLWNSFWRCVLMMWSCAPSSGRFGRWQHVILLELYISVQPALQMLSRSLNGFVNALLSFLSDAPFVVFCKHRCKSRRPTHKEICQQVSFGWSICSNRRKKIRREPFLKKFSDKHYWGRWSGTSSARRRGTQQGNQVTKFEFGGLQEGLHMVEDCRRY